MAREEDKQMTFADLELEVMGETINPILGIILTFINEKLAGVLLPMIHQELVAGLKNPNTGRPGLTPRQVLFSLILQRIKSWSLRELRERIADGITLRKFTGFYCNAVPKYSAFQRAFSKLKPGTMVKINDLVNRAAITADLENGDLLRSDTFVIETDVHFPTDASLLADSVRKICSLIDKLRKLLPCLELPFSGRLRAAKRTARLLDQMPFAQRKSKQECLYRELVSITEEAARGALNVIKIVKSTKGINPLLAIAAEFLCEDIKTYCLRADQVLDQTQRRVFEGETVPVSEKIFSIFETHTDLIRRGKPRKNVELGHKILTDQSTYGLITKYEILDGNPSDHDHVASSLQHHKELHGAPPIAYAADRGFSTTATITLVGEEVLIECLPKRGKPGQERTAYENTDVFLAGKRYRAGVEGTISALLRGRGLRRCLMSGLEHFKLFVGAGVLAQNLMRIANLILNPEKAAQEHQELKRYAQMAKAEAQANAA